MDRNITWSFYIQTQNKPEILSNMQSGLLSNNLICMEILITIILIFLLNLHKIHLFITYFEKATYKYIKIEQLEHVEIG